MICLCAGCHQPLAIHPRQRNPRRWCSAACRSRTLYGLGRTIRPQPRPEFRDLPCRGCGLPLPKWKRSYCSPYCKPIGFRPGIAREAVCPQCNVVFVTTRSRDVCCSSRCGDRRKWELRGKTGRPQKRVRQRVLRRDNWTCYLCGKSIPQDKPWPHPLSATVDHVVPVAAGGSDREDNLRAAHWHCNESKGDSLPGTEVWVPMEAA